VIQSGPPSAETVELRRSPVDIAKSVCQLECPRPANAHEDIENLHERNIALGMFAQHRPELGEVTFHGFDDEFLGEWLELVVLVGAGFDGLRDEAENADGIERNEE
jgi:hypothetical protein